MEKKPNKEIPTSEMTVSSSVRNARGFGGATEIGKGCTRDKPVQRKKTGKKEELGSRSKN